jgi:hypothetical protein
MDKLELILSKLDDLHDLRSELVDFMRLMEGRVAALETDNHTIMGNGQPGRMTKVEDGLRAVWQRIWWAMGAVAAIVCGAALGTYHWFFRH